jgi:hypothetical protein
MAIPSSPPRRYTASKQLIAGDDINNIADQLNSFQSLVPGANAQNSAFINASNVELTTAAAGGVTMPISYPGAAVNILNNSGQNQAIFPNGTDQIQNAATTYAAASASVTLNSLASASYFCIKKGFWQRAATA